MLTIYLARHGETVENKTGVLQGRTPGHLNDTGKAQVAALRDTLVGKKFDVIVSSDLGRALASAEILNEAFGLEIEPWPLLREREWGSMTGFTYAEANKCTTFPDDVETLEQGMSRAAEFLNEMLRRHDGKTVLAVGHGFINRCILAVAGGVSRHEVEKMGNADCRIITLSAPVTVGNDIAGTDEASAN